MMDFDRPGFLYLIPAAVVLLGLGGRHSLARWPRGQALVCLAVRGAIAVVVALALAGPRVVSETRDVSVVFLNDVSASIPAAARESARRWMDAAASGGTAATAEVAFAREARVVRGFAGGEPEQHAGGLPVDGTEVSAALEYAAALLPADRPGRIVLLSDGVDTGDRSPLEVAGEFSGREIDVVPLRTAEPAADVAVTAIAPPPAVREGEVFDLPVSVHASVPQSGVTLRLYQNNLLAAEMVRDLRAGGNDLIFPNIRAEGRMALYDVEAVAANDGTAENNRRKAAVAHGGPPRVLILDNEPPESEALAGVLRASGFAAEIRPAAGFPAGAEALEAFDLIILADVPAGDLSENQMTALEGWVKNFGGGFLMTGGEDSFGAGGYFRTPVSTMLPVRIEREEREETPVVALLVILDRSGSMSAPVGGQTKMDLANEGAVLAMEVLQPRDLFGLFAVDTRVQDVVPLDRIADKAAAARRIAGITAGGGGVYIYTSLAEALPRLRDAQARIKHIILFSDAADAEEKSAGDNGDGTLAGGSSLDLAAAMLASRITLSVVALGNEEDKDTAFLRQLAGQGGGRFYLTADATTLPRLFTMETLRAAESSLREDAFLAQPKGGGFAPGIVWQESPLLLGLNATRLKPGAELLLATERGDPLLAEWRYGLGRVAAFTSDAKARWAAEWLAWPGYGKFWTEVARLLVRSADRPDLSVHLRETGRHLVVEAEAVDADGTFRNGLRPEVSLAAADAPGVPVPMTQTGPGRYAAILDKPDADMALVAVSDGGGRPVSVGWTRGYPREYQRGGDGTPLLAKLAAMTGGTFDGPPGEALRPARHPVATRRSLTPWLLGIALVLWPLDVWLRRRDWPRTG